MTDLAYSIAKLSQLGSELVTIADVMDGRSPAVRYDADDVGHRKVDGALDEFASSWDDKRELLTASLRAVGGMALQSAEVFEGADDELAAKAAEIFRQEER